MTAVVVGASAGRGRSLAERLAATGHDLVIASSDAARVVRDLGRREGVVYHPWVWRPVGALLPIVPWFVFKRLRF